MVAIILLPLMVAAAGVAATQPLADDESVTTGNGPIIVGGTAYDPSTGEIGPDPCNCTTDASWSADGQRVAFRRSSRILVADLAKGSERQIADCTGCDTQGDHISMAADGQRVAFTDEGDVWLVDVDTGKRTRITDLGGERAARAPTLAPEGDRLAFVIEGEPGVWVVDLLGSQPWLLTGDIGPTDPDLGPGYHDPAWSPDGRTIAYLREPGLDLQLWSIDVTSGEQRRIWDWPGCCMTGWGGPAWSPDGRELAVVATDAADARGRSWWFLWVVAADGTTARNLGGADPVRPAWRPEPLAGAATPSAGVVAETHRGPRESSDASTRSGLQHRQTAGDLMPAEVPRNQIEPIAADGSGEPEVSSKGPTPRAASSPRSAPPVAGGPVIGPERGGQVRHPARDEALDVRRPEPVADGLQGGRVLAAREAVGEGVEGEPRLGRLWHLIAG
jgi:hypothetical protein